MSRLIERNPWTTRVEYQARSHGDLLARVADAARAYIHHHATDPADEALLLDALGLTNEGEE